MKNLEYDVLIAGSDQIWNSQITDGIDEVYLLQFGHAKRRVSIASSMGSSELSDTDRKKFQKALKTFDAISVREEFGKQQLSSLTDKKIKILMDPTFLLPSNNWLKLTKKSKYANVESKYILTFFVAPNNTYKDRIQAYSDFLTLPVWSLQPTIINRIDCDKRILGATVYDLIALIANAELVITDSFHGTVLSINLGRNFVSLKNTGNPVRVKMLLDSLGIAERIDMSPDDYHEVDYKAVYKKLKPLCEDSRKWVIDAVEGTLE